MKFSPIKTAYASSLTTEKRAETRYLISMAKIWRKKNGKKPWVSDARLMMAADLLARRVAKSGLHNFSNSWLSDSLRKAGYTAISSQVYILGNERSKEANFKTILRANKGQKFLSSLVQQDIGFAYLGPKEVSRYPNLTNVRLIITAKTTQQVGANWSRDIQKLVNEFRKSNGLPKLKMNSTLTHAAQAHADDMALKDYVAHINLKGKDPGYRAERQGYKFKVLLENLAAGQTSAKEVVEAWKASKDGHREAMINPRITEMGLGYRYLSNDDGRVKSYHYWAMSMANPQ